MIIKNEELYPLYVTYLEHKNLTAGQLALSKISESSFMDFKKRYDDNPEFKKKIDNFFRTEVRDLKIEEILDSKVEDTSDLDDFFNF